MLIVITEKSLQDTVEACSQAVLMRKMMKRQMPFMIPLIEEWMIEEKREGMMF